AAPAPAKEDRDIEKGFPTAPVFDNKPLTRSAAAAAASAFPPSTSMGAPSFGSLDDEGAESDPASKKRVLVGAAVIVLVVAGYFGYTKFHKKTLVVNGGFSLAKTPEEVAASSEVPAPPTLGNMSGADQGAISSIVQAATPAAVPKVAPKETLKVSQGVTQGLLLKRVQPNYPR